MYLLSLASCYLVIQTYITHFTQKSFFISCFLNLALKGVVETGVATFLSTVLQVKIAILEKLLTLIQVLTSQYWFISALMKNNNLNHNRLFYSSPKTVEKVVSPRITSVLQVSHHVM